VADAAARDAALLAGVPGVPGVPVSAGTAAGVAGVSTEAALRVLPVPGQTKFLPHEINTGTIYFKNMTKRLRNGLLRYTRILTMVAELAP
jgi:hypothetical protein